MGHGARMVRFHVVPSRPAAADRARRADDEYQVALDKIMPDFIADLLKARSRLRAMGVPIASERQSEPLDPIEEMIGPNPWRNE